MSFEQVIDTVYGLSGIADYFGKQLRDKMDGFKERHVRTAVAMIFAQILYSVFEDEISSHFVSLALSSAIVFDKSVSEDKKLDFIKEFSDLLLESVDFISASRKSHEENCNRCNS